MSILDLSDCDLTVQTVFYFSYFEQITPARLLYYVRIPSYDSNVLSDVAIKTTVVIRTIAITIATASDLALVPQSHILRAIMKNENCNENCNENYAYILRYKLQ